MDYISFLMLLGFMFFFSFFENIINPNEQNSHDGHVTSIARRFQIE